MHLRECHHNHSQQKYAIK